MFYKTRYLLASTALVACALYAAPSWSDTAVKETVTQSPGGATVLEKTVTETPPGGLAPEGQPPGTAMRWQSEKEVRGIPTPGNRVMNVMEFDLNKDGVLSVNEIGQILFKLYDTDGNEVIDNNEFERRAVVTIVPMEKNTSVTYDFDGDGRPDETKHTYETFMQDTQLTRFDKNRDGLSPHEFTDRTFLEADVNEDKTIDIKEWQGSYIASIDKKNIENASVNK